MSFGSFHDAVMTTEDCSLSPRSEQFIPLSTCEGGGFKMKLHYVRYPTDAEGSNRDCDRPRKFQRIRMKDSDTDSTGHNPFPPIFFRSNKPSNKKLGKFYDKFFDSDSDSSSDDEDVSKKEEKDDSRWPSEEQIKDDLVRIDQLSRSGITSIDDLIMLGNSYHPEKNTRFADLDLCRMNKLVEPLMELKNMIGMELVKEEIVNHIVYFLQDLNRNRRKKKTGRKRKRGKSDEDENDMMHTVITGPPGVGKTELGKILGKLYNRMGILKKGHMRIVKRADLIGKYVGHTAPRTQGVIDSCKGGVMFIDEAYALGHREHRDTFAKECLDTLNQNLSENRDFLCIVAGYEKALEECFFSQNPGLQRRFPYRYHIDGYNFEELKDIFCLKVKTGGWKMLHDTDMCDDETKVEERKKLLNFFRKNYRYLPRFGGDIETLFLNVKICHGRRVLLLEKKYRKVINSQDIEAGFKRFVSSRKYDKHLPSSKGDGYSRDTNPMMMYTD